MLANQSSHIIVARHARRVTSGNKREAAVQGLSLAEWLSLAAYKMLSPSAAEWQLHPVNTSTAANKSMTVAAIDSIPAVVRCPAVQ